MAYTPNQWKNDSPDTPLSAERLNTIEQGIESAHTLADSATQAIDTLEGRITDLEDNPPSGEGVSQAKVEELINTAIGKIPAGITDEEAVRAAVTKYLADNPPTVGNVDEAVSSAVQQALRGVSIPSAESIQAEITKQINALPKAEGVSPEKLTKAVSDYLAENPPSGASEEAISAAVQKAVTQQVSQTISEEISRQIGEQVTAAGATGVTVIKPAEGGNDITANLQAAVNDPEVKVIELPAGQWQLSDAINLDKATGKVIRGQGEGTVVKALKNSGKNAFQSTSAGTLKSLYVEAFVVDMGWETGDKPAHGFQITNSENVTFSSVKVKNSGGHGFVAQGFARKDKPTGNGSSNIRWVMCEVDGAGLKQNPPQQGASGFGILVKDQSPNAQVVGCKIRGVSCGMGIGGSDTLNHPTASARQGAPEFMMIVNNSVEMAENPSIAFEPIGLTVACGHATITGNVLPVSKDNGISVGRDSTITGNVIGETWNHGIAVSGTGTKVSNNVISNVGKENFTRLKNDPKDWAVVSFEDPNGCSASGNSYTKTDPESQAKHFIKINIGEHTPRESVGGNFFYDNHAKASDIEGEFIKNANWNPKNPDVIITSDDWQNILKELKLDVDALSYWFDPQKIYTAFVTYWWYDPNNVDEKWQTLFANIDVVPWVIVNPRSGPGEQKEPNFAALAERTRRAKRPAIGYVRTTETFTPQRTLRSKEVILSEIAKHVEWYGVDGVFLDEMINGWSTEERALVPFYTELYKEIKAKYGRKFLVVGNPGTNTVEAMLNAADVLMTFENTPDKYLNDSKSPVKPAHYAKRESIRFCHAIHNVESEEQLRKLYAKFLASNAMFVFFTTDTFSGVLGSESESNNPWDNLPAPWCVEMNLAIARRNLLPASVYSYQNPAAAS